MLETINDLIANKKIPAFEPVQMMARLQYVFTPRNVPARTRIASIVCRHRDYPESFELFLAGTLPLAHRPLATAPEVN